MVVEKATGRVVVLIEIEETTDTPKTFLGDIFGLLMGRSITFRGKSNIGKSSDRKIGNWTTLIILGKGSGCESRNEWIRALALKAKSVLDTENSSIGDIVIMDYEEKPSWKMLLEEQIEKCIKSAPPI